SSLAQKKCFVTPDVCAMLPPDKTTLACATARGSFVSRRRVELEARGMPHAASTHAMPRGGCHAAVSPRTGSCLPTRRMRRGEVGFHRELPPNVPTMVGGFGGWVDAGEAATGALRYLVRQLAATPLATIDPEEFVDFTTLRPVVRLSAEGQRTIRWPRIAF